MRERRLGCADGQRGSEDAGRLERYGLIGADVAAVVAGTVAIGEALADEDDDVAYDELPADPIALAVLAILDDRDPAGVDDAPSEDPLGDDLRYVAAAEDIAEALQGVDSDAAACTRLARDILETRFGTLHRARLAAVGVELAELVVLAEFVRTELDPVKIGAGGPSVELPSDPFAAGILALLERHDPAPVNPPAATWPRPRTWPTSSARRSPTRFTAPRSPGRWCGAGRAPAMRAASTVRRPRTRARPAARAVSRDGEGQPRPARAGHA